MCRPPLNTASTTTQGERSSPLHGPHEETGNVGSSDIFPKVTHLAQAGTSIIEIAEFTLSLPFAEHFQSKPILQVPKDVILIYSLSPLNGAALTWQPFSRPRFKEHTILFLPRAFQNPVQGLSRSFNGCQSFSMLHFIHGCQGT